MSVQVRCSALRLPGFEAHRLLFFVLERVFLEAIAKAAQGEPERLRGDGADAARALERLDDETPLDLSEHAVDLASCFGEGHEGGARLTRGAADLVREIAETDLRTARESDGALDDVL